MKRTIFSSVLILALVVLCYAIFSFSPGSISSKSTAEGTIEVCWGPICTSAPETTVINLVDADGNTLGTCTITPPNSCCKITGDFPTGVYHFEYYRPIGMGKCKTADFRYRNGTDVSLSMICRCP